jgi:hypothetical protein
MKPNTAKANPQQQQMYDLVMVNARKVIYGTEPNDNQRFEVLVQKLKAAQGEVGDAIGQTAALILTNVSGALAKKGMTVPPEILYAAGRELVAELIVIAQSAKVIPPGKQTAIEQQALQAGLKAYQKAQQPPQAGPQGAPVSPPPQPPQTPAPAAAMAQPQVGA